MLRKVDESVWEVLGRVKIMPAVYFPCRMTIVRLDEGRLLLHSPVELDDATAAEIEELGDVRYLVAPNAWHHLFLEDAQRRFPGAETWGAPGLREKRDDLEFDAVLGQAEPPWSAHLEQLMLEGASDISETVFFHRSTGTLICTDVVFNLHRVEGWLAPWMCRLFGTYQTFAHSKLWRSKYDDIQVFADSVRKMLEWPIERIMMAHGEVVDDECTQELDRAFRWLFEKAPAPEITSPSRQSTA
ncbi:MAG: DUF4336 domain-containing protein [Myxococcota bacterium]